MKLELARSSDEEIARVVTERCAPLGAVARVTVYAARAGAPARPFALVAMGTRETAERVSTAFGGRTVGNAVIVFLEFGDAIPRAAAAAHSLPAKVTVLGSVTRH